MGRVVVSAARATGPRECCVGSTDCTDLLRLEHNPEFLQRVAQARTALPQGEGVRLEDLEKRATKSYRRLTRG